MKNILLSIILFSRLIVNAQAPGFAWAKNIGGPGSNYGSSITTDAQGNVYTTGYFQGTIDFDPGAGTYTLTSAGSFDIFISKLDASGNFAWAKSMGSSNVDYGISITADASGNVYTTGHFQNTVDFDPGAGTYTLASAGGTDIFISKLNAAGNFAWAKRMGGTGTENGCSIAIDAIGNVYTTGAFMGTADFDPGAGNYTLSATGILDIFVSKLDVAGNFVWAKSMGGTTGDYGNSVAVDGSGNVFTTGYFNGTADFDPGAGTYNLTSVGNIDIFISKLDAGGNFAWAKSMGGIDVDQSISIATDASGNVYTTGYFQGTVDFDPGAGTFPVTSGGNVDIFVSKLDAAGNFVWIKNMGTTGTNYGNSIAVDFSGNVYTTGYFEGTVDFNPGTGNYPLTASGIANIFISKLDASGNFVWAGNMGGSDTDFGTSIHVDGSGSIYTIGSFKNTVDFDPGAGTYTLAAIGSVDFFVHKMTQCLTPAAPLSITPAAKKLICAGQATTLTVTGTGTINWYSSLTSTTSLGTGTAYTTPSLTIGFYTYYTEVTTCTVSTIRTLITVTVSACTGIASLSNSLTEINVYPNPFNDRFTIALNGVKEEPILIYNAVGMLVYISYKEGDAPLIEIDLSDQPAGIYFIKLGQISKKVIKD